MNIKYNHSYICRYLNFQKGDVFGTNIEINPNRYRTVYLSLVISIVRG